MRFLCFLTNFHKLRGLKQHRLVVSQFLWMGSLGQFSRILCPGPREVEAKTSGELPSSPELGVLFQASWLVAQFVSLWLYD